jgi:hypothetical protein
MRPLLVFAFVTTLAASVAPSAAQSRTFDKTVTLKPGGSLSLKATKGSVRLTAWAKPQVRIHALIEASGRTDASYAREAVEATKVDVSGEGDSVRIRSNYDDVPHRSGSWWGDSQEIPEIHYEISAPARIDLTLDIDRSNSDMSGFDGRVTIESDRSELRLTDVSGELRVNIDRGGRSRFENVTGSFELDGDRTDVDIAVSKLTDRGRLELDRGVARIRVAERQSLTLRTDIERRGSFETELPLEVRGGSSRSPEGTINGGGPTLTVIAHRARVELRKL